MRTKNQSRLSLLAFFLVLLLCTSCANPKQAGAWLLLAIQDASFSPTRETQFDETDGESFYFDESSLVVINLRLDYIECQKRSYTLEESILQVAQRQGGCSANEYKVEELTSTTLRLTSTRDPQKLRIYRKMTTSEFETLLADKNLSQGSF